MKDWMFKLRILGWLLRAAFDEWRTQIANRDLDGAYCCNGHECGCQASTVREMWSWNLTEKSGWK